MKILSSPWILMGLALVLHLAGYMAALMTHQFTIPELPKPEIKHEPGIDEILDSRSSDYDWYFKTEQMDEYITELQEREKALDEREQSLNSLSDHLDIEREELDELKKEIERRHRALSEEIMVIRKNEISNLRNLASSYSNISPEAAVVIFDQMDQSLVVKILSLMKPDVVGLIFEEMAKNGDKDPAKARKAAQLSEELRLHYKEKD